MSQSLEPRLRQRILRQALLARRLEEKLLHLYSQGHLAGTVHTCIGQEFTGAVVCQALDREDVVFSGHRCHGHFLAHVGDTRGLLAELMGLKSGVCQGRGGSQHLHSRNFFSNGILGGGAPIAAGVAWALHLGGLERLACLFLGDGALGEGVLYETLNLASLWKLPLLVVLEDNQIAQSTPQSQYLAGSIAGRAQAFGIEVSRGSTWEWQDLYHVASSAVQRVRQGRPHLLWVETFRLKAHSKGDDTRQVEWVQAFAERDPLSRLLQDEDLGELEQSVSQEIEQAYHDLLLPASGEAISPLQSLAPPEWSLAPEAPAGAVATLTYQALAEALASDPRVIVFGEDVEAPYGGAFKVTQDLSQRFPGRVLNTPISEAALIGVATGLALEGFRPVVEIMFGDFLTLGFDQLVNHAAKFPLMYGASLEVNLVVRTPMGGRRGYGPTHSQSLEKHFLGVPGLQVLAENAYLSPKILLEGLTKTPSGPSLLIENKLLYATPLQSAPQGFDLLVSQQVYPAVWIRPQHPTCHLTLLGYGGMGQLLVQAAEELFEQHDRLVQVLLPSRIYPFDWREYVPIWSKAAALLVVEEGQSFAAFGAEVLAQLAQGLRPLPRLGRLGAKVDCIPASPAQERASLPQLSDIVASALELLT